MNTSQYSMPARTQTTTARATETARRRSAYTAIDAAYRDPIAAVEPDTWFLNGGRVAALAHLKGRDPRELFHERTDEKVLTRLFEERVLKPASGPAETS